MAGKSLSIWVDPKERDRFQAAADARGLSVSTFMKQCAELALKPLDQTNDFRRLAADLRSDLSKVLSRIVETEALGAEARSRHMEEQSQALTGFLKNLTDQQLAALKFAVGVGQGKSAVPTSQSPRPATDLTPQAIGLSTPPPLKGNTP